MIQTNRTLLIEEIAPNKENLISLIQYVEQRESLSDEEINVVHEKLEVSSFEEVIEKFNPEIYMYLDTDNMQVNFYRTMPEDIRDRVVAVPLGKQSGFFEEVVKLMDNKRKNKYVLTSFQDFGEALFPIPSEAGFKKLREEIFIQLAKGNERTAEKVLSDIISKYDEGIFLIKTFLEETSKYARDINIIEENKRFVISDSEDAQVHLLKASESFETHRYHTDEETERYFAFLNKCLSEVNIKNRNLLILLLELGCVPRRDSYEVLIQYYRAYQEYYGKILQSFWWEARPLLETLLGIKSFFGNYSVEKGIMPPVMIITNCTPELLANSKYKNVFRIYLESMNEKNYLEKTIWYAIMPRIPFNTSAKAYVRERFAANGEKRTYQANDINYIQPVLEILGDYHIATFLSVNPNKENVFYALEKNGIEEFESSFAFLEKENNKEYMIPCYPNFLIIPKEYTLMSLGIGLKFDDMVGKIEIEEDKLLWMEELIVEASYVAAGLLAACQCPQYLLGKYPRNVRQDIPGVAYRLCENEHNLKTTTLMFPEIMKYSEEVKSQILRLAHGMIFAPYRGKVIALTDRVYSYKVGREDCISIMQTLTYMERIIRYESQDYKEHLIKAFFQSRPGSIISQWKDNSENVNGILKKEEQIEYNIDDKGISCTFKVRFKERNIEDSVKISR